MTNYNISTRLFFSTILKTYRYQHIHYNDTSAILKDTLLVNFYTKHRTGVFSMSSLNDVISRFLLLFVQAVGKKSK